MGRRGFLQDSVSLAHEAARIICDEAVVDYRTAKRKAVERLGLPANTALPDNARIEAAVIEYQRLYGGREYAEYLQQMRRVAVQAMRLLARFEPRLVGGTVSGAISLAHRVQLHAFGDQAELLDVFLQERGIPYEQDERNYRFPDGSDYEAPLVRFEAGEVGIDIAVFPAGDLRRAPLSPTSGLPMKRLTLEQAEALAAQPIESLFDNQQ
jgi:hypothetical protein